VSCVFSAASLVNLRNLGRMEFLDPVDTRNALTSISAALNTEIKDPSYGVVPALGR
jgi:hypothetical protein